MVILLLKTKEQYISDFEKEESCNNNLVIIVAMFKCY